ncbi:DMT family transporter [Enterovirga rhinocerotis]|uniref:Drug/metabolite transporter (DMT)-like permease n=1 Tax=Enterovirga rhinocerotis TaxID=1339210 RepID=A0A4V3DXP3_9HYPH|nr:DMT family transporter [Enterovirga rhinocerotis]TDR89579.1 drug/metabolite transporter (DMT)-like permease [Enterovirga rhinocerotis]
MSDPPGRVPSPRLLALLTEQPYLLLPVAMVGWAATAVAGRLAVGHVSPMAIVVLRVLVVLIVLGLFARRTLSENWRQALPHWRYILAMGACGYTLFSALFYSAAHYTSAVNMGVIQGVSPALILAGGFIAFGSRFTAWQGAGVAVTLVGVVIVASRGSWDTIRSLSFNLGDLGILAAALFYSGYTVALRRRPALDPLVLFAGMTLASLLVALPLPLIEAWHGSFVWPDARGWALVLFIGLVPSFLSQVAFMRGVALIGPARAGLFLNLMPIAAAILGVAILGETFALYHAAGLAFVLGGIWLSERGRAAPAGPPSASAGS